MVAELVAGVRDASVTAVDLVTEALENIERLDGALNSVVATRAEEAVREAAALDELGDARSNLALAGVPVLVKDTDDVPGLVTGHGSRLRQDSAPARRYGVVPGRLSAAGAVVVGKTNTPEFAFEGYTDNVVTGATRNPWGTHWSPGGSSGGSAAALASGMVPVATATDGGGSTRIPAALTGLLGLKPTTGLIGRDPIPAWLDVHTDGVLAARAADLRLLTGVISGAVAGDVATGPVAPVSNDRAHRSLHLEVVERLGGDGPLPQDVQVAFDAAVEALGEVLGATVRHRDLNDVFADVPAGERDWDDDWLTLTSAEQAHLLGRDLIEQRLDELHPQFASVMRHGLDVSAADYLAARRRTFLWRGVLDDLLTAGSLLVTPTVVTTGFPPDGRMGASAEPGSETGFAQTVLANLTGHPALSLPAGTLPSGLPFGLQVTAGRWHDEVLLDLADRWESYRPWPLCAPGYEPFGQSLLGRG